jgi:DNA-directed RNA polymerase subunit N
MGLIVPVRCFSCGKVVSEHYEEFKKRLEKGEVAEKIFNDMGLDRYCCRRTIFSQVDVIDEILKYPV